MVALTGFCILYVIVEDKGTSVTAPQCFRSSKWHHARRYLQPSSPLTAFPQSRGKREVDGQQRTEDQTGRSIDESHEEHDSVERWPLAILPSNGMGGPAFVWHMPASYAMPPQHVEDDRDDDERAAIQDGGTPLLWVAKIGGQYSRRKRDPGNKQEEHQVNRNQGLIRRSDEGEQPVMIDPHHADGAKARQKGQIGRPEMKEGA